MYRTPRNQEVANKAMQESRQGGCVFCDKEPNAAISKKQYFYIINNRYPYDYWDFRRVEEHLLLIPYDHVDSLEKITQEAGIEYLGLLKYYQSLGYDVFTRSSVSIIKSQPHLHTHLFKTKDERLKRMQ